jgi:hypothetical protein
MSPFLLSVFLSAFLLFQLQPIIARFILPAYGGTPAVWTACMMFFQVALLCGYLYAHLLANFVPAKRQPLVHLSLLVLSLLLLPVGTPDSWTPTVGGLPALEILVLLALSVGVPFILISASGPLLQHWYSGVFRGKSPFRLYAVSNLGSLIALLSYPIVFEPTFTIATQATIWSFSYGVLVPVFLLCGIAFYNSSGAVAADSAPAADQAVTLSDRILWTALAACGSTLLLATTNQICQDVAVVPFLWILPLSLYLITFIICFDKDAWYRREIWITLLFISLALVMLLMFEEFEDSSIPMTYEIGIYSLALFSCCMVCHGELARRRSAVPHLTTFYLYVALGGALGGVFANLVAPVLFTGFWELHIALAGTLLLAGVCLALDKQLIATKPRRVAFSGVWSLLVATVIVLLVMQVRAGREDSIYVGRSFFGVMYVDEWEAQTESHKRAMYHGRIQHGGQYMRPTLQRLATSYYGLTSGVGTALSMHPQRRVPEPAEQSLNIGIVGLGVGTLSTYGRVTDTIRYYEINPQVEQLARDYFVYLRNGKAATEVVLGDARVSLQRELLDSGSNEFDILIVDAFSGDSIPMHLLTAEAFELYAKHLRKDGILAIHITNQYLDLSPVIRVASRNLGMDAVWIEGSGKRWYEDGSDWVLVSSNRDFMTSPAVRAIESSWSEDQPRPIRWTDDFSNLLQVVKWDN